MRSFLTPRVLATGAMLLASLAPAARATILTVASSSASSQFENHTPSLTTNGSGITASLATESLLLVAGHDNDPNAATMWHSAVVAAAGQYLIWNLSTASNLRTIYYWNHNQNNLSNRGIQNVDIQVSKDSGTTYTSLGTFTLIQASGLAGERAHTIELPVVQTGVTNIRFNIASNFGGNVVGLSEIRFSDIPVPVPAPAVTIAASPAIVLNGTQISLDWTGENVSSASISPGVGTVAPSGTMEVTPPASADTAYTITGGTATATTTVRSVPGGTSTWRYLKYTPKKLRGNGNSVQITEMYFYTDVAGQEVQVLPESVTNPLGSNPAGQEADKIIDGDNTTKWLDFNKSYLIFDFGETPITFSRYQFLSGGDAVERDPIQWILEGSNDLDSWSLVDNVTAFDFPYPLVRTFLSDEIPLPGAYINSLRPVINSYTLVRSTQTSDLPTELSWDISGATKITLKAGSGAEQDVTGDGGQLEIPAPSATTLYTLTGYSATNVSTSAVLSVSPVPATLPVTINYPDFGSVGDDIVINGSASFINDFFSLPGAGNKMRLRLTPDLGGQNGSAWFYQKVPVKNGIDTSFGLQLATKDRGFGADGLAFVIQNTDDGTFSLPGFTGPAAKALTIDFSPFYNAAVAPDTTIEAQIRIYKGNGTTQTPVANYNLRNTGLVGTLRGQTNSTLTGDYTSTPYAVRVTYSAAGVLDVYMDGFHVVDSLAVALDDAVDGDGNAYVGFASATGGYWEDSDITSWTLTSGTAVAANPLKLTAYNIDRMAGTLSMTWSSTSGKTYRITGSADLATWVPLKTGIAAGASGSTSSSTSFTLGSVKFFRVEEE